MRLVRLCRTRSKRPTLHWEFADFKQQDGKCKARPLLPSSLRIVRKERQLVYQHHRHYVTILGILMWANDKDLRSVFSLQSRAALTFRSPLCPQSL